MRLAADHIFVVTTVTVTPVVLHTARYGACHRPTRRQISGAVLLTPWQNCCRIAADLQRLVQSRQAPPRPVKSPREVRCVSIYPGKKIGGCMVVCARGAFGMLAAGGS